MHSVFMYFVLCTLHVFVSHFYFRIVTLYSSSRYIYVNVYGVKTFVFNAFCFRTYV